MAGASIAGQDRDRRVRGARAGADREPARPRLHAGHVVERLRRGGGGRHGAGRARHADRGLDRAARQLLRRRTASSPSSALVPRTGMLKTTDSLDTVGVLARSVDDLRLVFDVIRVHGVDYPLADAALRRPPRASRAEPGPGGSGRTRPALGRRRAVRPRGADRPRRRAGRRGEIEVDEVALPASRPTAPTRCTTRSTPSARWLLLQGGVRAAHARQRRMYDIWSAAGASRSTSTAPRWRARASSRPSSSRAAAPTTRCSTSRPAARRWSGSTPSTGPTTASSGRSAARRRSRSAAAGAPTACRSARSSSRAAIGLPAAGLGRRRERVGGEPHSSGGSSTSSHGPSAPSRWRARP